jgi:hypothetical protein
MTQDEARGIAGLGHRLIRSLPAQFLALLVIVCVIVLGLFWHLDNQLDARERILAKMVEGCMKVAP